MSDHRVRKFLRQSSPLATFLTLTLTIVVFGTGCGVPKKDAGAGSGGSTDVAAEFGLAGLDAKALIDKLDQLPVADRPKGLSASVEPNQVVLTDAKDRKQAIRMPAEETYVSVSPYLKDTHECHFHALTSCLGELKNAPIKLTVTDQTTGAVIRQESTRTFDNGFIGLWLPRNLKATVTIEYDGHRGSEKISTVGPDDATCVTTLQLNETAKPTA